MPNNPNDRNLSGSQKSGSQQNSNQRPQSSSEKPQQSSSGGDINLRLTPEQQAQIRQATGKNLQSLSLSVEDLGQGESQGSASSRSEGDATGSENERMDEEV